MNGEVLADAGLLAQEIAAEHSRLCQALETAERQLAEARAALAWAAKHMHPSHSGFQQHIAAFTAAIEADRAALRPASPEV